MEDTRRDARADDPVRNARLYAAPKTRSRRTDICAKACRSSGPVDVFFYAKKDVLAYLAAGRNDLQEATPV